VCDVGCCACVCARKVVGRRCWHGCPSHSTNSVFIRLNAHALLLRFRFSSWPANSSQQLTQEAAGILMSPQMQANTPKCSYPLVTYATRGGLIARREEGSKQGSEVE